MKVRIVRRPTGCLNGRPWPRVGETIELDDAVAEGMIASGTVAPAPDKPRVETRPAPQADVEKRTTRPRKPKD